MCILFEKCILLSKYQIIYVKIFLFCEYYSILIWHLNKVSLFVFFNMISLELHFFYHGILYVLKNLIEFIDINNLNYLFLTKLFTNICYFSEDIF